MPGRAKPMTMAASWGLFSQVIFGDHKPSTVQYVETRRAFYAGMMSMQGMMNDLPENEAEAMAVLSNFQREAFEYTAEMLAEMVHRRLNGES